MSLTGYMKTSLHALYMNTHKDTLWTTLTSSPVANNAAVSAQCYQ